ncbi:MAG: PQQ-binding-like beta-propeller repeat protein, partial [Chloroflexi bacterium]|nr:PQQ-binding-like beta-propeller repeat protein [Chloroflexota bacterium]
AIAVLAWWLTRDTTPAPLAASSDRGEPAVAGATWSRAHGGASATRASTARLPASPDITWRYASGAPVLGLSADRERVYVARADGLLVALDAATGEPRWQLAVPGQLDEPPAIAGDRIYIGQRDGRALAIDGASGRVAWSRLPADAFFLRSAPLVSAGLAWAVSAHSLVVYDAESGAVLSESRYDDEANPVGAAAVGNHVVFSTGRAQRIHDRVNGAQTFSYPLANIEFVAAEGSLTIALGGARLLAVREDARPHWWERFRRQWSIVSFVGGPAVPPPPREWISLAPATALAPALGDGRVFVADGSGAIRAYELTRGMPSWERADVGARGAPVLTPDGLVVPVANALLVLDPATGDERARVALAEPPHALIVTEGGTYVTVGTGAHATAVIAIRQ